MIEKQLGDKVYYAKLNTLTAGTTTIVKMWKEKTEDGKYVINWMGDITLFENGNYAFALDIPTLKRIMRRHFNAEITRIIEELRKGGVA